MSADEYPDDSASPRAELRVGDTVLGSFRLLRELGAGAFATAYLAHQLGTDRRAVIKVPHRHLLRGDSGRSVRSRFAAELRASSRIHHPNVATVYTAGDTHGSVPVIAMEYIKGRNLRSVLKRRAPLPPDSVVRLAAQIASALRAVHAAGIIHRDVTPGNIMVGTTVTGEERYVLLDFGVARVTDAPSNTIGPVGTPRYMPPEQVHGKPQARSDMFALGAVLWWAVTGREYLAEIEEVHALLLRQASRRDPPDPRQLAPDLPEPVARAILALMRSDPAQRPSAKRFLGAWPAVVRAWSAARSKSAGGGEPAGEGDRLTGLDGSGGVLDNLDTIAESSSSYAEATGGLTTPLDPRGSLGARDPLEGDTAMETVQLPRIRHRQLVAVVIDDNPVRREALRESLTAEGCKVTVCASVAYADAPSGDLVLVAQSGDGRAALDMLAQLRRDSGDGDSPSYILIAGPGRSTPGWEQHADHRVILPDELGKLSAIIGALRTSDSQPPAGTDVGVIATVAIN
ncbi:MAG: serine/threonine-protein kinase, partial [Myxococcota bacterium]